MENKNKLSPKLNLCYNTIINQTEENNNPTTNIITNYEELKNIITIEEANLLKFYYFNRNKNHQILYDDDEIIPITILGEIKSSIYLYFYLSLLIDENPNVVNYKYSFNFIRDLNEEGIKEKQQKKKQVIIAKIIIDLITNYEQIEEYEEEIKNNKKQLDLIKQANKKIIQDNINDFKEFNLQEKDILSNNIEQIYIKIIENLIKKQKLDESEDNINIIKELGLESINLTNNMFKEVSKLLDKNQNYLKEYIISNFEDIFDIKKITFYYILLRYILKSKYYIYHCPFLLETRNKILKLIRDNIEKLYPSIKQNKDNKDKIEYVLKFFILYDWYYNQSIKKYKEMKSNPNSLISSNKSNIFDNQSGQYNNQGNNNYSISSNPGFLSIL